MGDGFKGQKTPKKRHYNLIIYIVVLAVLMVVAGLGIKHSVGTDSPELQKIPAVAVPFAVLHDKTLLGSDADYHIPWQADETEAEGGDTGTGSANVTETSGSSGARPGVGVVPGGTGAENPGDTNGAGETADETGTPEIETEPALEFHEVDDSYFADALFIGDSRTDGLSRYGRIPGADYFCTTGMSVFNLFERTASDVHDEATQQNASAASSGTSGGASGNRAGSETQETVTPPHLAEGGFDTTNLEMLLRTRNYGKIYIMLGINEIGYNLDSVCSKMTEVVSRIRELQPDAYIILMANLTVTQRMASAHPTMTADRFAVINNCMAALADKRTVFYIDANSIFADSSGYLNNEFTGDGCHLYAVYYSTWRDFIKQRGVG